MMEVDPKISFFVLLVAEGVLHLGLFAVFTSEIIITHGNGIIAVEIGLIVLKADIEPGLQGKAVVFREIVIAADKIG